MNKSLKQFSVLLCLLIILICPCLVVADTTKPLQQLEHVGTGATGGGGAGPFQEADETKISLIVNSIIKAALSLMGVIFLILMIYGGYLWMTAHGNEEQVTKAKNIIFRAIIGLIIVVSAYAITYFVYWYIIWQSGALVI